MSQSFSNNINSLNTTITNNFPIADERSQILTWLSPLEPTLRHQDIRESRAENVGEWLLQTEEFRSWYTGSGGGESDNAALFCYGDPGVGKTYISSLVIDRLCDQARGQNVAVACFYFDFAAQKEQSSTGMLGAVLKQVVGGLGEVPWGILQAYEDQKKVIGGRGPQLSDISKMLQTTSSERLTFICVDAMDECAPEHRIKILDSLNQILQKSPGTRIFMTGRSHIRAEIGKRLYGRVSSIAITPSKGDVIGYLRTRLKEDTNPDAMDSSLEADILRKIPEDISEIFLLISLNIDAILQETTIHRRRQMLNAMTDGLGLGGAYAATMDRIKGQGGEKARLGMATLMWISHAERPLKLDELLHALAIEIGSPDLNCDNIPSIGTLLTCCQGLVVIDKEASIVRLIHFTLQEYLRAYPQLFGTAHSTIAETCLSYLNSQEVKALSTTPSPDLQRTPFLDYSSLYWGTHAKRDLSDRAKQLARKLFDDYKNHISAKILLKERTRYYYDVNFEKLSLFSGLHCASMFGVDEIVVGLIEVEGCDINQSDCDGNTPLVWAACGGHEGVVKILLRRDDVDPDKPGRLLRTPLCWAARNGHEGVVKILLGRGDVSPKKTNQFGETPLCLAAKNGHEGVVKILLGRVDVDPDKPGRLEQTPLSWAAENGHEGIVKILLGRDNVNPDKADRYGHTPLCFAACGGHEGVVKILLGRDDVNPNTPSRFGQTPLCFAAENGHEGVVKILLGRADVNPNIPGGFRDTPLTCAAENGHEGVVKILLGRDDVNPDKPGRLEQTPLSWAAENGHEGVVKILLGRDNVNPNKADPSGNTPLCRAALYGHEGVVEILLGRGDVNPDKPGPLEQTPLSWAAENGHEGVVKILLGRDNVNPNKADLSGHTPLCRAAFYGHEEVVEMLLGRDDLNPNKPDDDGQTPLTWAANNGHEGVVKILLGRDDVNPGNPGKHGRTPLGRAAEHGHEGVVKILLGRDDVNPDKPDSPKGTPLCLAAENGHEGVVKLLLGRDDVNPNKSGRVKQTPLCFAAKNGNEGVVKLLLGRDDVNPEKPGRHGRTPLCWAAEFGHEGVVKILLQRGDVNPNKPDEDGRTPLSCADQSGHAGVIALLQPLASTRPSRTTLEQVVTHPPPSSAFTFRSNSLLAISTRTTPTAQTRPPQPLPPPSDSRTISSRTPKRCPR